MHANSANRKPATSREAIVQCVLFDADGDDRTVDVDQLATIAPADNQLLWVDVCGVDVEKLGRLLLQLGFPQSIGESLKFTAQDPLLRNHGEYFEMRVVAASVEPGLRFSGSNLGIAAGANRVLTVHADETPFLTALRNRERGDTRLGLLDATLFVTALLDWHLGTYFDAVAAFEQAADKLETAILEDRDPSLKDLRDMRKSASRLRAMLAPHRRVFAALVRPDFRPEDSAAEAQFGVLDAHFERAMDRVDHARDLVVGSFEMFSSRMALRTNESMRALTFATVVIGGLAVLAGILGMNFEAPFFKTGARGFWIALSAMTALLVAAIVVGRRRNWL